MMNNATDTKRDAAAIRELMEWFNGATQDERDAFKDVVIAEGMNRAGWRWSDYAILGTCIGMLFCSAVMEAIARHKR